MGPCGCPCDACSEYCEQLDYDPLRPMTRDEAIAISEALADPDQPTRKLPPREGA